VTPVVFEKPARHENAFPEEMRGKLYEFLTKRGWEAGWKSNSKRDGYSFLHKHYAGHRKVGDEKAYDCEVELLTNAPLIYEAWMHVREKVFAGHTLVRCYANGMAYGMDGTVHHDASEPGNYTAVYYPHERWSPNWGGETMIYNQGESRIVACSFPRPNSIIVFDGRMPHRAAGVTRSYPGMRITLMFKTEKPNAV
jgi:SM-20-related protein